MKAQSIATRAAVFERKVARIPEAGCWIWTGYLMPNGYGRFHLNGEQTYAHRAAYSLFKGEIPDGSFVLHRCDVRCCVNPEHLFLGDHEINMADMVQKDRQTSGEKNGQARLTARAVQFIRETDMDPDDLAEIFDVHPAHIRSIRAGRRWSH